jgi:glycosyltransferase involved in cell wall biosynthesis
MSENNSELISVIMPFYNAGKFLAMAIESILNQSYKNLEFIIINDGSTDGSDKLVTAFSDKRIRYYSAEHKGIVAQLNFGIDQSKGKFIARMDADDISHPERLQVEYDFLKANSNVSAVGSSYYRIDEKGNRLYKKRQLITHKECKFIAPINSPLLHPTLLTFKNVLIDLGGYSDNYNGIEDYDLFNRMINAGYKIANIDKYLFSYRLNKSHINSAAEKKQQSSIYSYGRELLKTNIKENEKNYEPYFQLAVLEYYLGKVSLSRKYLFKTLKLKPGSISKVLRYLPLTLLGERIVNYLRRKKILYNFSMFLKSKFSIDTNKMGY